MGLRLEEQKNKESSQKKVNNFRDEKFVTERGEKPIAVEVKKNSLKPVKPHEG